MARVLLTGASGHVGSNTVRSLLNRGHEVVSFVRRNSNLEGIENLGRFAANGWPGGWLKIRVFQRL